MGIYCIFVTYLQRDKKAMKSKLFVYLNALRLWKIIMIDN
jgi:hypothetical protein